MVLYINMVLSKKQLLNRFTQCQTWKCYSKNHLYIQNLKLTQDSRREYKIIQKSKGIITINGLRQVKKEKKQWGTTVMCQSKTGW